MYEHVTPHEILSTIHSYDKDKIAPSEQQLGVRRCPWQASDVVQCYEVETADGESSASTLPFWTKGSNSLRKARQETRSHQRMMMVQHHSTADDFTVILFDQQRVIASKFSSWPYTATAKLSPRLLTSHVLTLCNVKFQWNNITYSSINETMGRLLQTTSLVKREDCKADPFLPIIIFAG